MINSIGVIGGADGPTAVFVTGDPVATVIVLLAVIVAAGIGVHLFRHRHDS